MNELWITRCMIRRFYVLPKLEIVTTFPKDISAIGEKEKKPQFKSI